MGVLFMIPIYDSLMGLYRIGSGLTGSEVAISGSIVLCLMFLIEFALCFTFLGFSG